MLLTRPDSLRQGQQDDITEGYLHSVETGAAVDGPGMRYVFFMAGCQFRCLYCHNPDTWKLRNGRLITIDGVLEEVGKYAGFLKMTGGVTFSGGEPMMQAGFVGKAAAAIKEKYGLHIALDTQGSMHDRLADDWFDAFDLVMLDIKHMRDQTHRELTAQPVQPTLDCAERLVNMGKKMRIRHVMVPGWSDAADDLALLADYVARLGECVELVELLPFHQMGTSKWDQLGKNYRLRDCPTPTPEEAEAAREIFRARGLKTI